MKKTLSFLLLILFVQFTKGQSKNYDIVIYGGTSSGVAAAIQSSRMGKSVVLIEPTNRIGGLTTGGLGQTDMATNRSLAVSLMSSMKTSRPISMIRQIGSGRKNLNTLIADRPEREKMKAQCGRLSPPQHSRSTKT